MLIKNVSLIVSVFSFFPTASQFQLLPRVLLLILFLSVQDPTGGRWGLKAAGKGRVDAFEFLLHSVRVLTILK